MAFKKAVKEQSKLRLALDGLAGTGKTYSSLAVADAIGKLMREHGHGEGRIAVIDSERGSASLYADKFDFDVDELESFSPLTYVERIKEAEHLGYDIIVCDSISHAWMGKDGALDQKDEAAARSSSGNTWTAWRAVTPKHNAFVDAMLQCKAHFIATMRQKMEYAQQSDGKKTEIVKLGLAAIQREGMEYEFTVVGDLDHTHTLKISKSRISTIALGEQFEKPGEAFGRRLYQWLTSGAPPMPRQEPKPDTTFNALLKSVSAAPDMATLTAVVSGPTKPAKGTPQYDQLAAAYLARKAELTPAEAKAS
ncbi:MAG TPA: ATP-binding protein [Gemmatimonadaceae bacterium]|nr:ATP-binding protein [Gemmatimonadaceae bacterium]